MPESIDPTSDRPVCRQIADQLRQAIREGRYGDGDALPSETALAETYGVTRMTARQAMDVLKNEGWSAVSMAEASSFGLGCRISEM
jgi:GntR family transcriptional regulator